MGWEGRMCSTRLMGAVEGLESLIGERWRAAGGGEKEAVTGGERHEATPVNGGSELEAGGTSGLVLSCSCCCS